MIMNRLKDKLLDILLYPAKLYEKITDGRTSLFAGIVLIGAIDLLLPDAAVFFKAIFSGKPANTIYINAVLTVLVIVLLGIIDVTFVSIPLFDFFNFLKKKEGLINLQQINGSEMGKDQVFRHTPAHTASRIKIMKVYILSHFVIIPVTLILHYAFLRNITDASPLWVQYLTVVIFISIYIWSAAIMTRGINTLFRFNPIFARLTFIIVFSWNYLFAMVFDMQIMNWMYMLFR